MIWVRSKVCGKLAKSYINCKPLLTLHQVGITLIDHRVERSLKEVSNHEVSCVGG